MKLQACITLCAALLFLAGDARGQESAPGQIQGVVLDHADGQPVAGALVYLDQGSYVRADGSGIFSFDGVPPGRYAIAAVGPGCATAVGVVSVEPAGTLVVNLRIVTLDVATTQVPEGGWDPAPSQTGAWVRVITADEIDRSSATNLLDLLRSRVPGLVGEVSGASEGGRLRGRGNNTATQSTEPVVILDGARIERRASEVLSQLTPNQVTRIEIYRGSAGAWVHGTNSANGVIRVFTRSSGMGVDTLMDPARCGNPFGGVPEEDPGPEGTPCGVRSSTEC